MVKENMYSELAKYYDLTYTDKNYKKEAEVVKKIIRKYKKSKGKDLLDVGCGTGAHLPYLIKDFNVSGTDLNKEMIKIAKKKFPKNKFYVENMIKFDLNKKYDIITSLFSSIAYVKTYENLNKTIKALNNHLKPGGVMIIEPFVKKELYIEGHTSSEFHETPQVTFCRMGISGHLNNDQAKLEFQTLIKKSDKIEYYKDTHTLGIFDTKKFLKILKSNRLKAEFIDGYDKFRGLYVAVKNG